MGSNPFRVIPLLGDNSPCRGNIFFRYRERSVRPEKFQFLEKGKNHNFGCKIVISVKNPKFILWISDDETDFTVGIVSRNLGSMSNFVEF